MVSDFNLIVVLPTEYLRSAGKKGMAKGCYYGNIALSSAQALAPIPYAKGDDHRLYNCRLFPRLSPGL